MSIETIKSSFDDYISKNYNIIKIFEDIVENGGNSATNHVLVKRCQDPMILNYLLQNASTLINFNAFDVDGDTILIKAVKFSNFKSFEILVGNPNIDINFRNNAGETALIIAAQKHDHDFMSCLMERPDLNLDLVDMKGNSALHHAVKAKLYFNCILLRNSFNFSAIDLNIQNDKGMTALMISSRRGSVLDIEISNFLLDEGTDVDLKDNFGNTALISCVKCNPRRDYSECVSMTQISKFIVNKSTQDSILLTNKIGKSALTYCVENENINVIKIILSKIKFRLDENISVVEAIVDYKNREIHEIFSKHLDRRIGTKRSRYE